MNIWKNTVPKSESTLFKARHFERVFDVFRQPLGWLAAVGGFSVVIGLVVGQQGWLLFGVCMSLGVLGVVGPWLQARSMVASLGWSKSRVVEGESVEVVLRIRNRLPFPLWGLKLSGLAGLSRQTCLSRVGAWGESEFRWEVSAGFRGRYPTTAPELRTGFPFGFTESAAPVELLTGLLVHPRLSSTPRGFSPAGTAHESHRSRSSQSSLSGEFCQLRKYRPGDLLKLCDWKQTARTGEMVVRENENPTTKVVHFFLDPSSFTSGESVGLEVLLRAALMTVKDLNRYGQVVLFTLGGRTWTVSGRRNAFLEFLDEVCAWQPDCDCLAERTIRPRGRLVVPCLQDQALEGRSSGPLSKPIQPFLPLQYRTENNLDEIPGVVFSEVHGARQTISGVSTSTTQKELSCA